MKNRGGFIKSYRCVLESSVFKHEKPWKLWSWLMHSVTYKETTARCRNKKVQLKPGEVLTSLRGMSREANLSLKTVRWHLDKLEEEGRIVTERTHTYTKIYIVNWDSYQHNSSASKNRQAQRFMEGKPDTDPEPSSDNSMVMEPMELPEKTDADKERHSAPKPTFNSFIKNPPPPPLRVSERIPVMFRELYKAFPRQGGRAKAERIFEKLKPDRTMLEAMVEAIRSGDWNGRPKPPRLGTWLLERKRQNRLMAHG